MANPTVSLIIGMYNRGLRIARTLNSVVAQTCLPDEVIVVDDGSTDGTGDWIRAHYPTVRVLTTPNGGTSAARNRGAAEARGDVLIFLDHDDTLRPHAVATLLKLLDQFPDAQAAYADHTHVNLVTGACYEDHHSRIASFHRLRAIPALRREGTTRLYGRAMHRALLWGNLLQQPWAIYRRTFLKLGGFEPTVKYCEDWDMYLRVAASVPLALSDEVIADHVVEGSNLHLTRNQEPMHKRVIARQIQTHLSQPAVVAVLLRRLGLYHKWAGDHLWNEQPFKAWFLYLKSALTWPFAHVVLARLLLGAPLAGYDGLRQLLAWHPTRPTHAA
jgi:glycosyltransferase involved in cell wall biosynthesis